MRSTKILTKFALVGVSASIALTGCSTNSDPGSGSSSAQESVPNEAQETSEKSPITVTVEGSRAEMFNSLEQLAQKANAIVQVESTGKRKNTPLPMGYGTQDSAPIEYVELTVTQVIEGEVQGDKIWVVSPGLEDGTENQALSGGGPYILFLAPAMYDANEPIGGYVVVGGPAGMFVEGKNSATTFFKADSESPKLPAKIDTELTRFPKISKTEKELLAEGP